MCVVNIMIMLRDVDVVFTIMNVWYLSINMF